MGVVGDRKCPAVAPVVAEAALRLRTSRDTALLNVVTAPAAVVRDRRLHSAALKIVTDRTASPEARVFAMRMLAWLFYPNADLSLGDFVDLDGDGDRSCFGGGPPMDLSLVRGERLPSGWPEAIKQAARGVHRDSSEPESVRRAALCFELMHPDGILRREGIQDAQP